MALHDRYAMRPRQAQPAPARQVITVRVERELFDRLHERAHQERVSLNRLCIHYLAAGLGDSTIASETGADRAAASA